MWLLKILAKVAGGLLGVGLVLVMTLFVVSLTGFSHYHFHTILSSSMEPSLPAGSLLITRRLAPLEYRVGDVVTFRPSISQASLVTHRIVRVFWNERALVINTKGDANAQDDPWTSSIGAVRGKQIAYIPYIGYAVEWLKTPQGFLWVAIGSFFGLVLKELLFMASVFGIKERKRSIYVN